MKARSESEKEMLMMMYRYRYSTKKDGGIKKGGIVGGIKCLF